MSERKPSVLVKDILNCIDRTSLYTEGLSFQAFATNFMVLEACLYNIQIIGEAVTKLPDSIKKQEIGVPWALMKGMRNRLIHEYFGTDLQIVWNVIKSELPEMIKDLERIYASLIEENL
jgi:uncharacterized protein with HEPN domain